ncbi:MAG: acetate--CoA ligase family protein, partial [Deltaproteobacteria bacterium]|nr:acetate--CoA ligase family protein [Deltaproteobacteria bacterium]
RALAGAGAGGAVDLSPPDLLAVLRATGIACAMAERVAPELATATAERVGYPLVMKAEAPGLVQRRAAGAVLLGLRDAAAVARAADDLRARIRGLTSVELQRQIGAGVELQVAVRCDPTFGPLVVCAAAGAASVEPAAALRLPPVSDLDAEALLADLQRVPSAPALDAAHADRAALIDVIRRVSALVDLVPELRALLLEPLTVLPPGQGAVVLRASLRLG